MYKSPDNPPKYRGPPSPPPPPTPSSPTCIRRGVHDDRAHARWDDSSSIRRGAHHGDGFSCWHTRAVGWAVSAAFTFLPKIESYGGGGRPFFLCLSSPSSSSFFTLIFHLLSISVFLFLLPRFSTITSSFFFIYLLFTFYISVYLSVYIWFVSSTCYIVRVSFFLSNSISSLKILSLSLSFCRWASCTRVSVTYKVVMFSLYKLTRVKKQQSESVAVSARLNLALSVRANRSLSCSQVYV